MTAQARKGRSNTKRPKRKLHTKWAQKFIALYQCKLSHEEREQVEAHLQECKGCADAYLVYRQIAGIVQDRPVLMVPSELPPKLQALKEQYFVLAPQNTLKPEIDASVQQTLEGVNGNHPNRTHSQKKHPA